MRFPADLRPPLQDLFDTFVSADGPILYFNDHSFTGCLDAEVLAKRKAELAAAG